MATCDTTQASLTAKATTLTALSTKALADASALDTKATTLETAAAVTVVCRGRLITAKDPHYDEPIEFLTQQINAGLNQAQSFRGQSAQLKAKSAVAVTQAANFTAAAAALAPPTPTVTGVSPNTGVAAGNTPVTITGTNFTDAIGVTFGGNDATAVVIVNDTTITARTPAHAAGAVTVTVFVTGSSGSKPNAFTYT